MLDLNLHIYGIPNSLMHIWITDSFFLKKVFILVNDSKFPEQGLLMIHLPFF